MGSEYPSLTIKFAFKVFFISKLGDLFFVLYITIFWYFNGFTNICFYILYFDFDFIIYNFLVILILIVGGSKSPFFGFHIWLPDAMEGPIPVSAMIHAATLVVAGIILIINCHVLILFWYGFLNILLIFGLFVSFLFTSAIWYCYDLKRFVAFSTLIQISFCFGVLCFGDMWVGCFFTVYHMFYKCLCFCCLGYWLHIFFGMQDARLFFFLFYLGSFISRFLREKAEGKNEGFWRGGF